MSTADMATREITGRHVLAMIVGFFLLIIATDAWLVYKAVSTFGGIETQDAYRRGLAYNNRLADEKAQEALGWSDGLTHDARSGALTFTLRDREGAGLDGKWVTAVVGRAATNAEDRTLILASAGEGRYRAIGADLPDGAWIATISVRDNPGETAPVVYRSKVRLWIKP